MHFQGSHSGQCDEEMNEWKQRCSLSTLEPKATKVLKSQASRCLVKVQWTKSQLSPATQSHQQAGRRRKTTLLYIVAYCFQIRFSEWRAQIMLGHFETYYSAVIMLILLRWSWYITNAGGRSSKGTKFHYKINKFLRSNEQHDDCS